MERRLWIKVYHLLEQADRNRAADRRSTGVVYSDVVIAAIYFWQVIGERTQEQVCDKAAWPRGLGSLPKEWPGLPSRSQFGRRVKSRNVKHLFARLENLVRRRCAGGRSGGLLANLLLCIDGKPLPVSKYTHDPDTGYGFGAGVMYVGYKLHAVWGTGSMPWIWCLTSANISEVRVGEHLMRIMTRSSRGVSPGVSPGAGYLLADAAYDSGELYAAAARAGRQLVAPRKRPDAGLGHKRHHPDRLAAVASTESWSRSLRIDGRPQEHPYAQYLHNERGTIERQFGRLTQGVGGLKPLPGHIRRLSRVRRWVQAKLIINALAA